MRGRMFCVVLSAALVAACSEESAPAQAATPVAPAPVSLAGDPVEGLRVATRVGCNGCHGADAAGRVFVEDPKQGLIVAPNLTKVRHLYTDEGLAALLHEGRTHDGHVPWGMPIQMFQYLSHQEVRDITAWLRSLPDTVGSAPERSALTPELTAAIADGSHEWLPDMKPSPGNVPPAAPPAGGVDLGRHLAFTSCGECHGWDLNGWGGPTDPPNLVVAKAYTPEQFTRLMRTGEVATGGQSASGLMSKVAAFRYSVLTDAEIAALKAYLDSR
ncbi:MAG TPA: cytochrome c [Hydrogenophaga sp.]